MAALGDSIIRVILLVFSITALGLTSAWVHLENDSSRIRYAVFSAAFSILFGGFYGLLAALVEILYLPILMAVIDFLNMVFLFAGATAVAAKTGAGSCSNKSNLEHHGFATSKECRLGQASSAFLYFSWACAVGNLVYSVIATLNGGSFGMPRRRSTVPRTGIPTASQV